MDFFGQWIAALGVLALMGALLWLLRRRGIAQFAPLRRAPRKGRAPLETVDRVMLTPQHSVHLVRVADRALLVGVSPGGCVCLERLAWAEVSSPDSPDLREGGRP
ncbi:MAG: flagellar biosynthetic protein FliO [Bryobacterales bacterium]|nr:flagellar biosynthetic protein FliO [Bryobacterales bacterium]